uniref:NADH-ubiquinone oxidoreductase chain 4 n=1 Tax=Botryllus schlosseri TaxID=30301 RepID=A0A024GX07_BOTSH|nr:NADH dehydrogenase subunit 4 [Botryllus schlosseri]
MIYVFSLFFLFFMGGGSLGLVGMMIIGFLVLSLFFLKGFGSGLAFFYSHFYPFMFDDLSFFLISLSLVITFLSIFSGFFHVGKEALVKYSMLMFFIFFLLIVLFSVMNYVIFFVLFEFIMMPMLLIIGTWGSQQERVTANYYFFFYTVLGAIPLLISVFFLLKSGEVFFFLTKLSSPISLVSFSFILIISMAFLCKLPMYGVHIWLPKAHVEAPVGGSMVLAGLLLKIGGYGIMRLFVIMFSVLSTFKFIFFCVLMLGVIYPMFICLRQVDLKSFIAYSSVSHMAISLAGLLMYNFYGFLGGLVVFLGHGFISPLMFFCANLIYERLNTRIVVGMGGMEFSMKGFFFFFLIVFFSNMGYPPFVSFFGELSLYFSLLSYSPLLGIFLFVFFLFSGIVMAYFLVKIFKGKMVSKKISFFFHREVFVFLLGIYVLVLMTFLIPLY